VIIIGTITSLITYGLILALGLPLEKTPSWFWPLIPIITFGSQIIYEIYNIYKFNKNKKTTVAKGNEDKTC